MITPESKILGLIPARGGSKGIPGKNVIPLQGRPLIDYTIKCAIRSSSLDRVIVSTDDEKIASVSSECGAEVPFLRPEEISADTSGALEVIQHAVQTLVDLEQWRADYIVYLQPTSPFRTEASINKAIEKLLSSEADSLVGVIPVPHQYSPISQMIIEDQFLKPLHKNVPQIYRRQDKPVTYVRNGPVILVTRYDTIMTKNSLYGDIVLPFEMSLSESLDIDSPEDLLLAEWQLARRANGLSA